MSVLAMLNKRVKVGSIFANWPMGTQTMFTHWSVARSPLHTTYYMVLYIMTCYSESKYSVELLSCRYLSNCLSYTHVDPTNHSRDICLKLTPQSIWIHCRVQVVFPTSNTQTVISRSDLGQFPPIYGPHL